MIHFPVRKDVSGAAEKTCVLPVTQKDTAEEEKGLMPTRHLMSGHKRHFRAVHNRIFRPAPDTGEVLWL